jgi:uncharacterized protein YjbI with pentapeptide repeats
MTLDEKFVLFWKIAIALAAIGGTSFRHADLTDVDFSQAILKSTDLRNALLKRTCWFNVKWLQLARISDGYLKGSCCLWLQRCIRIAMEGLNAIATSIADIAL